MKRLLRKWLKRKVLKYTHGDLTRQTFEEIYREPIWIWKDCLFALKCNDATWQLHYKWLNKD